MEWLYLALAIVTEVIGTTSLKLSDGLSRLVPSLVTAITYTVSIVLLALVLKRMDVGVAYAVWAALGTALIATIGMVWFKEPATTLKLMSLALVIVGVVGLNLSGAH